MPNLFPAGYENEIVTIDDLQLDEQPIGYKYGVKYDNERGEFIRDGRKRIVDANGVESWKQWCINCLCTERFKHLAYPPDFGINLESILSAESRELAETIAIREITEALMADPYGRTAYVSDITFNWYTADAVQVDCTVNGIDDVTIDITASLERR